MKNTVLICMTCMMAFASESHLQLAAEQIIDKSSTVPGNRINQISFAINQMAVVELLQGKVESLLIPTSEEQLVFTRTKQIQNRKTITWRGETDLGATVLLTIGEYGIYGHIYDFGRKYLIEAFDFGAFQVFELGPNETPVNLTACFLIPEEEDPIPSLQKTSDDPCGHGKQIDVGILYTSGWKLARGSAYEARLQYFIDSTNEAYDNSQIDTQLFLTHSEETAYPDTSPDTGGGDDDISIALRDLTARNGQYTNGMFNHIDAMMEEHAIDQLTMVRDFIQDNVNFTGGGFVTYTCGIAWAAVRKTNAYAVVEDGRFQNFECGGTTYAHEVGHNLGCAHDRNTDSSRGRYSYSKGYQEPGGAFVTVMGYDFTGPCPCGYIPHFSNPEVNWEGMPTGISDDQPDSANNAKTINFTRETVANYRYKPKGSQLEYKYYLPEVQENATTNTSIYVANTSTSTATIQVFGFSNEGDVFLPSTTVFSVPRNGFKSIDVSSLFPISQENLDWIQVASNKPILASAEISTVNTKSSFLLIEGLNSYAYIPHVAKNTSLFETTISIINGGHFGMETEIQPAPFGDTVSLDLTCGYTGIQRTGRQLFGDLIELTDWAEIGGNSNSLAAMEYFTYLPERDRMASLGLNSVVGPNLRFLHVATDVATFWTGLVYINVGNSNVDTTVTFYGSDGSVLEQKQESMFIGEKKIILFDTENTAPEGTVWVEVQTSSGSLMGYELFGSANTSNHRFFAGLQGSLSGGNTIEYPFIETSPGMWTGIVAVNTGTTTSNITFEAYNSEGSVVASVTVPGVSPKVKYVNTLEGLFDSVNLSDIKWVRATTSGSSWDGFVLWGDSGNSKREFLSGVSAVVK